MELAVTMLCKPFSLPQVLADERLSTDLFCNQRLAVLTQIQDVEMITVIGEQAEELAP